MIAIALLAPNGWFYANCVVPRTRTVTLGPRAFCSSGPVSWNTLPAGIRDPGLTLDIVLVGRCTRLCDYLVNCAFEMSVYYYYLLSVKSTLICFILLIFVSFFYVIIV